MTSTSTKIARLIAALLLTSLAMTMNADPASNKTLFDFQIDDEVMGGVSTSQFRVLTTGSAVFSGTVRLENNGGFASVRSAPVRENLTGLVTSVLARKGRTCT